MATIAVVSPDLAAVCVAPASSVCALFPEVGCEDLLDLFWFYGAEAFQRTDSTARSAQQSFPNGTEIRESLNTLAACKTSGSKLHVSLCGDYGQPLSCAEQNLVDAVQQRHQSSCLPQNKWLRRVFDEFDENKDGLVSSEELKRSFEKLGLQSFNIDCLLNSKEISGAKMNAMNHDDFILLYNGIPCKQCLSHQFCNAADVEVMNCSEGFEEENLLRDAFNVFDKDKDGFISPTELQSVLCGLGFVVARELEACVEMIRGFDQDGNGQVDFKEFKNMLNSTVGFH